MADQFVPYWNLVSLAYGRSGLPVFLRDQSLPDCLVFCDVLRMRILNYGRLSQALLTFDFPGPLIGPSFYTDFRRRRL